MKTLFFVDVHDNGKNIYLTTRDEEGVAYVLRIENTKRTLFYVFQESHKSKEGTSGIIGAYLQKIGIPLNEVYIQQRMMRFIDPNTREMTEPRIVVQVIFNRSFFYTFSQSSNLRKLPRVVDQVVGFDFTAAEFLLGYHNLKGWIRFDETSPHVKEIPTQDVFKKRKQYSLTTIIGVLFKIEPQPPIPSLLVFSIYQNLTTMKFGISSSNGEVEAGGLSAKEINELVVLHNPAVVCVHDFASMTPDLTFRDASIDKKNTARVDQLVVDTFNYAKELRPMKKDYALDALMSHDAAMKEILSSTPEIQKGANADHIRAQNVLRLAIEMGVVELIFQISARTGQPCSKVPSRLGRVEWMLLNRFIESRCVPPDKMTSKMAMQKSKESYTAGLVLEPKCGIYEDPVILLDFRSLYPSISIEHGVCYSKDGIIVPYLLRDLIETRKALKDQSAVCKKTMIVCITLKLLANATYGCLACPWSRFYSVELAKRITQYGRDHLRKTEALVRNEFKLDVVYGDTDSILVATPAGTSQPVCDALALQIIDAVNSSYRYLELEYEASFDCFILFGKKHYTGFKRDRNGRVSHEIKGLDLIKRGFSPMGARASRELIEFMLSKEGRNEEDAVFRMVQTLLKSLIQDIKTGIIAASDFVITMELSMNLSDYKDVAGKYHVQAALKQQRTDAQRSFQKGDFVKFVMKEPMNPTPFEKDWTNLYSGDLPFCLDNGWYIRQLVSMLDRLLGVYPSYNISLIQEAVSSIPTHSSKQRSIHNGLSKQTPSSSSSYISSSSSRPNIMMHPTAYLKRRSKIVLNCTHCENEFRYIGVLNLEISALNISKERPEMHVHLDDEAIQKLLPSNLKRCQYCETDYDFGALLNSFYGDQRDSLLLIIDIKRMIRQFDCLECKQNVFSFFKKNELLQFFNQFI